jgi:hypothetical protein
MVHRNNAGKLLLFPGPRPVNAADEVLAQVEAILRNDEKIPAYTVVAAIRIDRSRLKRKVLLLFPTVCSVESNETGDPIKTGLIENTSPNQLVDSVATILEQERKRQ